jgi:hypothetical protein
LRDAGYTFGELQSGDLDGEAKIDILPAAAVRLIGSVGPVVSGFVPRDERDPHYLQLRADNELIQGHAFGHRAINAVVSGFISLSGMLFKAANNGDEGRVELRIKEKLGAKADTVLYGFSRRIVEEFIGLMTVSVGGGRRP